MEPTTLGSNRTGAATSPEGTAAMLEAAAVLSPPGLIDTSDSEAFRIVVIGEAQAVGTVPTPPTLKGMLKAGVAKLSGGSPTVLVDKISERIAFERGGVRLYDALLTKYKALQMLGGDLPAAGTVLGAENASSIATDTTGETPLQTLQRIRQEEQDHLHLLIAAMTTLGADPTAQTPCADTTATASMGLIQVLTDPRTTMAQCLNAMLTAELTDNAGWELLAQLAEDAGQTELTGQFLGALSQEQSHLLVIKAWLTSLVLDGVGTPAV